MMKKQDILKMHGLTESEFYKRYPTEESYKMAMGGTFLFAQNGAFVPPSNAVKVDTIDNGYTPIAGQDPNASKIYFDKKIDQAKRGDNPITMTPEKQQAYQAYLIKQAQSGIHPDELIKKGYTSAGMRDSLMQYYKPVFTEKPVVTNPVKPNIPLDVSDMVNRKEIFPTGNQSFRTFMYPDNNGGYSAATTRYFDKDGIKEIDPSKSFDSQGNYVPSYIQSAPGAMGTVKQNRGVVTDPNNLQQTSNLITNTQSSGFKDGGSFNVFNTWAPDFFNSEYFKMGGTPCYNCGGQYMQNGGDSIPYIEPTKSLEIFKSLVNKKEGEEKKTGPAFPGQDQQNIIETKKDDFLALIRKNTMNAIINEENKMLHNGFMQMGGWNFAGQSQPQFTTPESVGINNSTVMMNGQTDQSQPMVSGPQSGYMQQYYTNYEPLAAWTLAGMEGLTSIANSQNARNQLNRFKQLQSGDNQFYADPGNNRGDYDQFGNIRPNAKVPVQFAGNNVGQIGTPYQFQQGGEYYMTDDQVNSIIQGGGEVEFLD